ncbi:putative bifunctional diguanylate cyclase/phosphodiesterase [Roseibium salinum]|uniref:Bifunctional diguanylate cyclase/phosphodiesterase n=1 Tax=Roseibium salinum TaxID=1604349 RepID=A0ABT3R5L2_9HYPH|nr:bifunctional diguanylate cyclase/phosphodiesterase [Roseibium sp. DSM 29163]MCX2724581.1 bifunctional diguanylate cyclase/phosphodiesterase [Roseibium sp. DSM 29163]
MLNWSEKAGNIGPVPAGEPASRSAGALPQNGIAGIPSGLVIIVMFCAVILSFGVVLFKVLVAEQQAAARELKSVSRVFENHKQVLLTDMERYAASNAAYQNIETAKSMDWIKHRFGADMAQNIAYDRMALVGRNLEVIFAANAPGAGVPELSTARIREILGGTVEKIRNTYQHGLVTTGGGEVRFAGRLSDVAGVDIVEIDGRPNLAAAFAVVPDPGGIKMVHGPPNILVTTFEIDAIHLGSLLASLSLDNLIFARQVPEDMISVPLAGKSGQVLGHLAWYPMSRASAIIASSLPILVISLGMILTITLMTLRQNANAKARLEQREQEARYAADHDFLTGFASRGYFHSAAARWLDARDAAGNPAAIIYLDLDSLKQVNDVHGHSAGDQLILEQSRRISRALGPDGLVGRIGGDEFVILTDRWGTGNNALQDIRDLLQALSRPVEFEGKRIDASCSAGIARFPDHGSTLKELIRAADIALQRCKMEHKNAFRLYDERMDDMLREQREVRIELDAALRNHEFELFYQPIVRAGTGETAYFEALIRWRHPERGLVPPDRFLPIALEAGMMPDIGAWVLERALKDACGWQKAGVSVNVCTSQIRKPGFAELVETLLRRYDFSPERLVLEITESLMLEEGQSTRETLEKLRDLKVVLAIDDFGTGYSSMSYLHKFRFDTMKIDRSFVSRIGVDEEADTLVRSLLGLAREMGMQTIGEGVETEQQKAFLVEAGCGFMQGYLFDRPLPLKELAA